MRQGVRHVFSTAPNGSVNRPWSTERVAKVKRWESNILRLTFRPRMKTREDWVTYRKQTSKQMRARWRKMKLPKMAEKKAETFWKTMTWTNRNGDVPVMKALRSILSWWTASWWRNRSAWCVSADPMNVSRWKHK